MAERKSLRNLRGRNLEALLRVLSTGDEQEYKQSAEHAADVWAKEFYNKLIAQNTKYDQKIYKQAIADVVKLARDKASAEAAAKSKEVAREREARVQTATRQTTVAKYEGAKQLRRDTPEDEIEAYAEEFGGSDADAAKQIAADMYQYIRDLRALNLPLREFKAQALTGLDRKITNIQNMVDLRETTRESLIGIANKLKTGITAEEPAARMKAQLGVAFKQVIAERVKASPLFQMADIGAILLGKESLTERLSRYDPETQAAQRTGLAQAEERSARRLSKVPQTQDVAVENILARDTTKRTEQLEQVAARRTAAAEAHAKSIAVPVQPKPTLSLDEMLLAKASSTARAKATRNPPSVTVDTAPRPLTASMAEMLLAKLNTQPMSQRQRAAAELKEEATAKPTDTTALKTLESVQMVDEHTERMETSLDKIADFLTKDLEPLLKNAQSGRSGVSDFFAKQGIKTVAEVGAKGATKVAEKEATKAAEKGAVKIAEKEAAKVGGKALTKMGLKKIPLLGILAGLAFGADRAYAGDWMGAGGEVLSGVASTIPGIGTGASLAIDAGLAARDMGLIGQETSGPEPVAMPTIPDSTTPEPVVAPSTESPSPVSDSDYSGLKLKSGDVTQGGPTHPGVIDLARVIQGNVPGFSRFTSFNDAFHQREAGSSLHTKGLAMDFTVAGGKDESPQAAGAVRNILRAQNIPIGAQGADVIDEYRSPSRRATGGHIHVEFNTPDAAQQYAQSMRQSVNTVASETKPTSPTAALTSGPPSNTRAAAPISTGTSEVQTGQTAAIVAPIVMNRASAAPTPIQTMMPIPVPIRPRNDDTTLRALQAVNIF